MVAVEVEIEVGLEVGLEIEVEVELAVAFGTSAIFVEEVGVVESCVEGHWSHP